MQAVINAVRSVRWYVGELMGDFDYAHYVEHLQRHHPQATVPTEREYWKARYAEQDRNPGARCC